MEISTWANGNITMCETLDQLTDSSKRHGYGKTIVGWSFSETTEEYITEWRFDEPQYIEGRLIVLT